MSFAEAIAEANYFLLWASASFIFIYALTDSLS